MKIAYIAITVLLILILLYQVFRLKSVNGATDKVNLIRSTMRYNVENRVDNVTFTTIGRSAKTAANWMKYF